MFTLPIGRKHRRITDRSGRDGARQSDGAERGEGGRNAAGRLVKKTTVSLALQGIEDHCSERLFESKNKAIHTKIDETKRPVDNRLVTVYSREHGRSSFLAADQCTVTYFVFVNCFCARHFRKSCVLFRPDFALNPNLRVSW